MPKRVRSGLGQKSKRQRHSASQSPGKRNPIPRSCKNTSTSRKGIVDPYFFFSNNGNLNMPSYQMKQNDKANEMKDDTSGESSASNDELDVVFDVQEEKKNKIYEVITVMSDDETPNQISYERIYAEDPAKRTVDESEIKELLSKAPPQKKKNVKDDDLVGDIVKEANSIKEKASRTMKKENETSIIKIDDSVVAINTDNKDDSDNEVICVAVLDPKTKAEQKRASVEEICLSSDSEPETTPKISPIRLKLPYNSYPYISKYRYRPSNEVDYGSNSFNFTNSNFSFGQIFNRPARLFPCNSLKFNDPPDLWDSDSSSSKASSVELSPALSDSPKVLTSEDSSSTSMSDSSQHHQKLNTRSDESDFSDNAKSPNHSSTSASSGDEEKDVYWKANRESRRKEELRYEEFTDFGKKIHEGEINLDVNTSFTFKVMSYNVLAQTLLEGHMYLYKNHDRRALGWARRWGLIYEEIKDENPEILCLQEVDTAHLASHYAKLLDLGYRWVYKKRTGRNQDGVAVFYKAAVFDTETHSQVEFYQPGVSVLDRDNVGLVLRLRLKDSPSNAIVVATTHLLYNPRRSDVRLAQMQLLLAEIDRLAYNKDALTYYPVILTGDFNLKPRNGVYQLLTEGQLRYEGTSRRDLKISSPDNNRLPRTLLPWRLGITDRCQHADVIAARVVGEDSSTTRLYNSEHNRSPLRDNEDLDDSYKDDRFESGTLKHGFNFRSVYNHILPNGQLEASTHHEDWVTVDYIFYSSPKSHEGRLQLISKLRLPTQDECERFLRHLPNFAFGSDHLPLVAKFFLKLQNGGHRPETRSATKLSSAMSASEDEAAPQSTQSPRQYNRVFLLQCADKPYCRQAPLNWEQITKECPAIARSKKSDSPKAERSSSEEP
ncbi:uncharacterized protein LOC128985707 isoform X2 [Macrosteles quadrilineatus]|nr:uncharacterized protein LOC128985707 isoform X2 [Macrosteles quadrilineatus]